MNPIIEAFCRWLILWLHREPYRLSFGEWDERADIIEAFWEAIAPDDDPDSPWGISAGVYWGIRRGSINKKWISNPVLYMYKLREVAQRMD